MPFDPQKGKGWIALTYRHSITLTLLVIILVMCLSFAQAAGTIQKVNTFSPVTLDAVMPVGTKSILIFWHDGTEYWMSIVQDGVLTNNEFVDGLTPPCNKLAITSNNGSIAMVCEKAGNIFLWTFKGQWITGSGMVIGGQQFMNYLPFVMR